MNSFLFHGITPDRYALCLCLSKGFDVHAEYKKKSTMKPKQCLNLRIPSKAESYSKSFQIWKVLDAQKSKRAAGELNTRKFSEPHH